MINYRAPIFGCGLYQPPFCVAPSRGCTNLCSFDQERHFCSIHFEFVMQQLNKCTAIEALQSTSATLFVSCGSRYYLAVATLEGELLEGTHFYMLHFARHGFMISMQQVEHQNHLIVLYDWSGEVLWCRNPQNTAKRRLGF